MVIVRKYKVLKSSKYTPKALALTANNILETAGLIGSKAARNQQTMEE